MPVHLDPRTPRRILLVHNRYQQGGGEDVAFEAEAELLEQHGHHVRRFEVSNDAISQSRSPFSTARLAANTIWSSDGATRVREAVRAFGPEVVHFHNTFPLISPAAYQACRAEGAAVVQTLHNYRLLCPAATFFREGRPCEDCLGRAIPWPGVVHACYRESRAATATTATMLTVHRALRTWTRGIDIYIALTEFGRARFIAGGFPAGKIVVKPNFLHPAPAPGDGRGDYALFVGRLAPEKGVTTLLSAWQTLGGQIPLKIAGDGPLQDAVVAETARLPGVEWLGRQSPTTVLSLMRDATALIFPSEWYEGLSRAIVESFAVGTPVIAADIGGTSGLIAPGRTGYRFAAGNPIELAATVRRAWADPALRTTMRLAARAEFEAAYSGEVNHRMLLAIYDQARDAYTSVRRLG